MSRSCNFIFVLNNPTPEARVVVDGVACRYMFYGNEVGESGTPHLQGYVVFKHARTVSAVKKLFAPLQPHIQIAKGNVEQNVDYSSKDGDFVERGDRPATPKEKGKTAQAVRAERNAVYMHADLSEAVEDGRISHLQIPQIVRGRQILAQQRKPYKHSDVRGVWCYGEPGTGKSRYANETYPDAYRKAQNKWFDEYVGQDVMILDDLDSEALGHHIKLWTDRYPCMGETKFGHVQLCHKLFVITSNYTPEQLFKDQVMAQAVRRRCEMKEFKKCAFNPMFFN